MSTNETSIHLSNLFLFFDKCVIKSKKQFVMYETPESFELGGLYVRSIDGISTLYELMEHVSDTYKDDIALSSGARAYTLDSPKDVIEEITEYFRKEYIQNYEETNKYVLNMTGTPLTNPNYSDHGLDRRFVVNIKDKSNLGEEIYLDEIDSIKHPVTYSYYFSSDTPDGVSYYKERYPDARYLEHIGESITVYDVRKASYYDLLLTPTSIFSEKYNSVIKSFYNESRVYLEHILRAPTKKASNYYDEYFFSILLLLTIGKLMSYVYDQYVEGVIIPPELRSAYLKSYQCGSLISSLSSEILDKVIKNMPLLNYFKGTDKVLKDILTILGIDTSDMSQHYIIKQYTNIDNQSIDTSYDKSPSDTFQLKVISVPFGGDPSKYVNTRSELLTDNYDSFFATDPTWGGPRSRDQEELVSIMKHLRVNYIQTKYISVEYSLDDSDIGYKYGIFLSTLAHIFAGNTVSDIDSMSFTDTVLKSSGDGILIGDATAMFFGLTNFYLTGEDKIPTDTEGTIYGINFDADYDVIMNFTVSTCFGDNTLKISEALTSKDKKMIKTVIETIGMTMSNIEIFASVFTMANECYVSLSTILRGSTTKQRRDAILKVRQYMFHIKPNSGIYSGYSTYFDYIQDRDYSLASLMASLFENTSVIPSYTTRLMQDIISKLKDNVFMSFGSSQLLSSSITSEDDNTVSLDDGMAELINYFKSWLLKIKTVRPSYELSDEFIAYLHATNDVYVHGGIDIHDTTDAIDSLDINGSINVESRLNIKDTVNLTARDLEMHDRIEISEELTFETGFVLDEDIIINESVLIHQNIFGILDKSKTYDSLKIRAK